jgi:hypothetical protein
MMTCQFPERKRSKLLIQFPERKLRRISVFFVRLLCCCRERDVHSSKQNIPALLPLSLSRYLSLSHTLPVSLTTPLSFSDIHLLSRHARYGQLSAKEQAWQIHAVPKLKISELSRALFKHSTFSRFFAWMKRLDGTTQLPILFLPRLVKLWTKRSKWQPIFRSLRLHI